MAKKQTRQNKKRLVVSMRHVSIPDAESRFSRVIDILLRSAATELQGSVGAKKEEKPPQDSQPEEVADHRDRGEDES